MEELRVEQISDTQSRIWIDGSEEQTVRTGWLLGVLAHVCEPSEFEAFILEFEAAKAATPIVRDIAIAAGRLHLKAR